MKPNKAVDALYDSIQRRPRPEDVAELVLEILGPYLRQDEKALLERAARHSLKRMSWNHSSMMVEFKAVVGADKMVATGAKVFALPNPPTAAECTDVAKVREFAERLAQTVGATFEKSDMKTDRGPRPVRKLYGRRRYNRAFRALGRFRKRLAAMTRNNEKYFATRVAKSAGATMISRADLGENVESACFVAYMSAKLNVRSIFTNAKQERAFDTIAAMLLERASNAGAAWYPIALVHPEPLVISALSEGERGRFLGVWTAGLERIAKLLGTLFSENAFNLRTMIVKRGDDSSSWNAAAGAWNKARSGWLSVLYSLGLGSVLDVYCPGKVMRLMAADVAVWHRSSGGDLDPNTLVWAELPKPWLVFEGKEECPRSVVEAACARHNVEKRGWVEPAPDKSPAEFRPTPELVHGVAVASPFLAERMRSLGWFSGKAVVYDPANPMPLSVDVVRDEHGFALGVVQAEPEGVDEKGAARAR